MIKRHLLAPGPTPVPENARLAMAASLIHHRGPQFKAIFEEVREHLRWAHQGSSEVVTMTCSGTGGFEAALTAFTARGDKILSIGGGKFGERWGLMGRAHGLDVIDIPVEWGQVVDPDAVAQALREHPDVTAVTMTASETSTGVFHPVEAVCRLVKEHTAAVTIIDGITAVGVQPMPMDEWGIDVLVSGSQKAFSVPPGLAFVAVNDAVWARSGRSNHPRFYLDLLRERDAQRKGQTAFTPAIAEVIALAAVLRDMREEGLEAIFARHDLLARATRAGVRAAGLELFAAAPANCTTCVRIPEPVAAPDVVKVMREQFGVTIAGGQDALKPFTLRIGHIGYFDRSDVLIALGALEGALLKLGFALEPGVAVGAAQRVLLGREN